MKNNTQPAPKQRKQLFQIVAWLLTLLLALGAAFSIYTAQSSYQENQYLREKVQAQKGRLKDLKLWYKKYQTRAERLAEWNRFWRNIHSSGLNPQNWQEYPLSISARLNPKELKQLLHLLGAQQRQARNTWFNPQKFVVSTQKTGSNSGNKTQSNISRKFYLRFSGSFLELNPSARIKKHANTKD